MNFVTNLPKQKPKVTYLVATGKLGHSCYRMHIVYYNESHPILCHMLRIQNQLKIGIGIPSRQHFKENHSVPEQNTEEIAEKPIEKLFNTKINTIQNLHPLDLEALMHMVAPFRCPLNEMSLNNF